MRAVRVAFVLVALAAAAAGVAWWRMSARDEMAPLDRDWAAVVTVLAGDGVAEWRDGEAYRARFSDPFGVAMAADGTVYVADGVGSHRIRAISVDGRVRTLAGGTRGFADGTGGDARFDTPSGLAIAADGTLYVADTGNNAVRRITRDGIVTTLAGDGTAGLQDGQGREARFNGPLGIAVDASGRVFVADTYNDRIRVVELDGIVRTIAADIRFDTPSGVAVDAAGYVYVADTRNRTIQQIDPAWTSAVPFGFAGLARPIGVATAPGGDVYVSDERGTIWSIHPDGSSRIVAGSVPGFHDGPGLEARFRRPSGVAVAGAGRLIVADAGNGLVRLVAAPSRLEFRAPPAPQIHPQFDVETFRALPLVWPIAPIEGPHEIAGTVGEARGDGAERMHLGIDVRAEQGTLVHAVRDGVAASPTSLEAFGTLSETITLGPATYIHVRAGRARNNAVFDRVAVRRDLRQRGLEGLASQARRTLRGGRRGRHDQRIQSRPPQRRVVGRGIQRARPSPRAVRGFRVAGDRARRHPAARRNAAADQGTCPRPRRGPWRGADRRRRVGPGEREPAGPPPWLVRPRLPGSAGRWHARPGVRNRAAYDAIRSVHHRSRGGAPGVCVGERYPVLRKSQDALPVPRHEHAAGRRCLARRVGYDGTAAGRLCC